MERDEQELPADQSAPRETEQISFESEGRVYQILVNRTIRDQRTGTTRPISPEDKNGMIQDLKAIFHDRPDLKRLIGLDASESSSN